MSEESSEDLVNQNTKDSTDSNRDQTGANLTYLNRNYLTDAEELAK